MFWWTVLAKSHNKRWWILDNKERAMSNEALYGLILLVVMVLALAGGIALVNWIFAKGKMGKR